MFCHEAVDDVVEGPRDIAWKRWELSLWFIRALCRGKTHRHEAAGFLHAGERYTFSPQDYRSFTRRMKSDKPAYFNQGLRTTMVVSGLIPWQGLPK